MKIVIDTEIIKDRIEHEWGYEGIRDDLDEIFEKHGTPLSKGHGKLIDSNVLWDAFQDLGQDFYEAFDFAEANAVIEADEDGE